MNNFVFWLTTGPLFGKFILLIVIQIHSLMDSVNCEDKETGNSERLTATGTRQQPLPAPSASLAVVLYDESKVTPFHQKEREFVFGEHKIVITQDWGQLGVAAVVWDAVSILT